jgi:hypothetical protein
MEKLNVSVKSLIPMSIGNNPNRVLFVHFFDLAKMSLNSLKGKKKKKEVFLTFQKEGLKN